MSLIFNLASIHRLHRVTANHHLQKPKSNTPQNMRTKPVTARLIVLTRNRAKSLARLLESAVNAVYGEDRVDIDIWIDRIEDHAPIDRAVVQVCNSFEWPYGEKTVHIRQKRVGLYEQWIYTWNISETNNEEEEEEEIAVILEDDLQLSPSYYKWLKEARRRYDKDPRIGGYTLQRLRYKPRAPKPNLRVLNVPNNLRVFKYRLQGTWGMSPKKRVWLQFRDWYRFQRNHNAKPYIRNFSLTTYYRKGENFNGFNPNVWSQWYNKFVDEMNYFSVVPHPPGGTSLCANWRESGAHYNGTTLNPDYPLYFGDFQSFNWPNTLVAFDWDGTILNKSSSSSS